jgi:hypothetical protein
MVEKVSNLTCGFYVTLVGLSGLVVIKLAIVPKVHSSKPSRKRRIFKGNKIPQHNFFRKESKADGPMS